MLYKYEIQPVLIDFWQMAVLEASSPIFIDLFISTQLDELDKVCTGV